MEPAEPHRYTLMRLLLTSSGTVQWLSVQGVAKKSVVLTLVPMKGEAVFVKEMVAVIEGVTELEGVLLGVWVWLGVLLGVWVWLGVRVSRLERV